LSFRKHVTYSKNEAELGKKINRERRIFAETKNKKIRKFNLKFLRDLKGIK